MIRFFLRNYREPLVRTERLKLCAGGAQLVAIGNVVGFIFAPFFNAALLVPWPYRVAAGVSAFFFEVVAMMLLSYLPLPTEKGN